MIDNLYPNNLKNWFWARAKAQCHQLKKFLWFTPPKGKAK